MQVVYPRCCGLDVHKKIIVACVLTPKGKEIRSFGTLTHELLAFADWLSDHQVTHIAMESSGVFWKPVWNILEVMDFELILVNARHMKAVPGRKTDVKDAEWIADLLRHGLLKASFVPSREHRELRELVRFRRGLIRQKANVTNRIQKVLEGANIKLASVVSDVMGKTGVSILKALSAGEEDPQKLSQLARGSLQAHKAELMVAVQGRMGDHQRFVLSSLLKQVEFLQTEIQQMDDEVKRRMQDVEELLCRLDEIPGVGERNAQEILAEIGTDMSRFPDAGHLASWARVCPGNHESGGKARPASIGPGNRHLRAALVEIGWSALHARHSYLRALFYRLKARRGGKRAVIAVAHTVLVVIYHMIKNGTRYQDLGVDFFDQRAQEKVIQQSVRRIEKLGFQVNLQRAVPSSG